MPMTRAVRTLLALTLLCLAPRHGAAQDSVRIRSGSIVGTRDGEVAVYKGIPFAAPPVGRLRWRPPQPASHWQGVRDATAFGLPCPQPPFSPTPWTKKWSEDCLTINVWTPAKSPGRAMPVLVVIPGGGFFAGGGGDPRTDGRELAKQGAVVVTFNYRLGVFGFFAHPMLSKESPTHTSGNYGLLDQIAALHWVQDNIAAFGGDPRNVTINGCSAGASSVLYLVVSPLARGLFARGISESAAFMYSPLAHLRERRYGLESSESQGARLDGDVAALRALSAEELLARSRTRADLMFTDDGFDYMPIVDGTVLPDEPAALFESGRFVRAPLIIGTNTDEATLFASTLPIKTSGAWRDHLAKRHPGVESAMVATYAAPTDTDVHAAAVHWVNDWYFHGTARAVARAVSARGVPVFLYGFSRVPPAQPARAGVGAFHSAEMEYVFGTLSPPWGKPEQFEDVDRALSRAMSGAWLQFARTGNPNASGLPIWPRYQRSSDQHLDFGSEIRSGSGLHAQSLDVFDRTFADLRAADRRARNRLKP
jgi:para-nitrobenzyl esterase